MSPPHRLSRDASMRYTRHQWGCPETQYGIEFQLDDSTIDPLSIEDCSCLTGAAASPVPRSDPQQPLGYEEPQPAAAVQERSRSGQSDAPPRATAGWQQGVLSYHGTFAFMLDMQKRLKGNPSWTPSEKQLAAIHKSLAREGKPPQQEESVPEGLDIMPLSDSRYAVECPDGTYYALVLSTGEGKWQGWRFVMGKALPSGEIERLGRQKPAERYSGGRQRDLVTVLTDPNLALNQYYEQTGICPICFKAGHQCPF
jgi:hypothetical protein